MKYHFDEKTNQMLKELEMQILEEYDKSPEIHVRVRLLPLEHNATSKYHKELDENGEMQFTIDESNEEHDKTVVAIHEATPGKSDGTMPTKPDENVVGINRYEKLLINEDKNEGYGTTIGYHAMIAQPGLMNRPEIVLYMPATFSPNQIGNPNYQKYAYGIERLCGDKQNYHLAIANQAMLTAFVLKEIGYDKQAAMRHVFPHNFLAKNKKDCPARMLYASRLLDKTKDGAELTQEELEVIKEYVPWQVFHSLVGRFLEREKFPQELEEKFIYDLDDYKAYMENPQEYNYSERRKNKDKVKDLHTVNLTNEETEARPISNSDRIKNYAHGTQNIDKLPRVTLPDDFER